MQRNIIENSIEYANRNFISGYSHPNKVNMNSTFKEHIKAAISNRKQLKLEELQQKQFFFSKKLQYDDIKLTEEDEKYIQVRGKLLRMSTINTRIPQYFDPMFPNYDLVRLSGKCNIIAGSGPIYPEEVGLFIRHTIFNAHLQKENIQFITLGNSLTFNPDYCAGQGCLYDFYDYCFLPTQPDRPHKFGQYSSEVRSKEEIKEHTDYYKKTKHNIEYRHDIKPQNIYHTRMRVEQKEKSILDEQITTKEVDVTLISLQDNTAFDLSMDPQNNKKEAFWQLVQNSRTMPTVIHCASGVGRTGHITLTILLTIAMLENPEEFFNDEQKDLAFDVRANKIASQSHLLLNQIRENRPALVTNQSQFGGSIRNAFILYNYVREKKYVLRNFIQTVPRDDFAPESVVFSSPLEHLSVVREVVPTEEAEYLTNKEEVYMCKIL